MILMRDTNNNKDSNKLGNNKQDMPNSLEGNKINFMSLNKCSTLTKGDPSSNIITSNLNIINLQISSEENSSNSNNNMIHLGCQEVGSLAHQMDSLATQVVFGDIVYNLLIL